MASSSASPTSRRAGSPRGSSTASAVTDAIPPLPVRPVRYHVVTLGCDKNTVDSERYVAELAAHGATQAASAEDAELIVINTCGFIDAAKQESIDAILEAARLKTTGACRMVAAVG